MGMDAHLMRVRNLRQPEAENFWDNAIDLRSEEAWEDDEFTSVAELWSGRKFWELHEAIAPKDYECGEWIEVTKPMLEAMLDFATRNPDYFGGFNSVPELCRALYSYDMARKHGWIYAYEADW